MDVLIVTGDRDAFQLVSDRVTVLYNARGVSDMRRMTPESVQDKYGLSPEQYPEFAALRGDPSDNLPSVPGLGEKTATKLIQQYGDVASLIDHVDEVKGKVGDNLRAAAASVLRNRSLTELVRDVPLEVGPHDLRLGQWDRDEVHKVFDALQFRVLRERLYATLSAVEPEADQGFDVEHRVLGPGEVGPFLAGLPRACGSACTCAASGAAAPATRTGWASRRSRRRAEGVDRRDRRRRLRRPDDARRGRRAGARRLARRRLGREGDARRQGPAARAAGARLDARRADERHRARRLPRAAGPGRVRPGRPGAALPAARAAGRGGRRRPADLRRRARRGRPVPDAGAADAAVRARAVADLAVALDQDLERRAGTALLARPRAAAGRGARRLRAHRHRGRRRAPRRPREPAARAGQAGGRGGLRHRRPRVPPRLAQAAAGAAVRRARAAEDQEDQDRLHDRRRRAAEPHRHPPGHRGAAAAPRDDPAAHGGREAAAADGRRRRAHPHDLQADGRRDRPAVERQPQPAERPDPHPAGPRDPPGLRRRARLRGAHDRRLQPDRDADHGPPVRRRRAEGGVPDRRGPAHLRRLARLRRAGRAGRPRAAPAGQGDVVRPGVRAVGVRPGRAAAHPGRRGQGADDGLLRALRRHPRLPARRRRAGAQGRLHLDDPRPPPLPARPHQRQRPAPLDGRADGAERADPGQRRRHHQAGDARRAPGAARRGAASRLLLQVHDELVLEVAEGEREALEALVRREMGGAYPLSVPLDVSVGVGVTWDEAGH